MTKEEALNLKGGEKILYRGEVRIVAYPQELAKYNTVVINLMADGVNGIIPVDSKLCSLVEEEGRWCHHCKVYTNCIGKNNSNNYSNCETYQTFVAVAMEQREMDEVEFKKA